MIVDAPKRICVLGSTGSIGTQAIDIIARYPQRYKAEVLVAGRRVDALIEQCRVMKPRMAVIADDSLYGKLRDAVEPLGVVAASGPAAIVDAVVSDTVDMVLTATVGYSGLAPTVAAIKAGKDIALANKETLVVAGEYITRLLAASPSRVYPVDSEHSAIYQCLRGEDTASVRRLIVTASGGPFRTWSRRRIERATAADALKHPNWSMGAKITIDSATMTNKAFELIEARWLFGIPSERISAVVHPQSIIHSMVEFVDGAIKAQLGVPDMRLPIAYALGETLRLDGVERPLSLTDMSSLTFEMPDAERFPCYTLAEVVNRRRGNSACIINAANEVAVDAFLHDRIAFYDIYDVIMKSLEKVEFIADPEYDDFVITDAVTRRIAGQLVKDLG